MDKIKITGLEFYGYHGVLDEEKKEGQFFTVDCSFEMNTSILDDIIDDTTNYSSLSCSIVHFCENSRYDLIETLANDLAKKLLIEYPLIQTISITINKPNAPIPLKFENVSISITRSWNDCYLSIGSNLGDRKNYLDYVSDMIEKEDTIIEIKKSSYYETKPYGVLNQPDFLNAVLKIKTILTPEQLLKFIQKLENNSGRKRIRHWGERTLDIDILMFNNLILFNEKLIIPHPEMHLRSFVLEPLCEIEPYLIHPLKKISIKELLKQLKRGEL